MPDGKAFRRLNVINRKADGLFLAEYELTTNNNSHRQSYHPAYHPVRAGFRPYRVYHEIFAGTQECRPTPDSTTNIQQLQNSTSKIDERSFVEHLLAHLNSTNKKSCNTGAYRGQLNDIATGIATILMPQSSIDKSASKGLTCLSNHKQSLLSERIKHNLLNDLEKGLVSMSCQNIQNFKNSKDSALGSYDSKSRSFIFQKPPKAISHQERTFYYADIFFHEALHYGGIENESLITTITACCGLSGKSYDAACSKMDKATSIDQLLHGGGGMSIMFNNLSPVASDKAATKAAELSDIQVSVESPLLPDPKAISISFDPNDIAAGKRDAAEQIERFEETAPSIFNSVRSSANTLLDAIAPPAEAASIADPDNTSQPQPAFQLHSTATPSPEYSSPKMSNQAPANGAPATLEIRSAPLHETSNKENLEQPPNKQTKQTASASINSSPPQTRESKSNTTSKKWDRHSDSAVTERHKKTSNHTGTKKTQKTEGTNHSKESMESIDPNSVNSKNKTATPASNNQVKLHFTSQKELIDFLQNSPKIAETLLTENKLNSELIDKKVNISLENVEYGPSVYTIRMCKPVGRDNFKEEYCKPSHE